MTVDQFLPWTRTASVSQRAQIAGALARAYLQFEMASEDRNAADAAMTLLLEDPSSLVRLELANALASSQDAPRHIIMELVMDTVEISTLVLARSPVFMDGELIDIMAAGTHEQQIAIARRGHVSSSLCAAIAEVGVKKACVGLLMNENALCTQKIIARIAERYGEFAEIRRLLLIRNDLDADIRTLLLEKIGEKLEKFIVNKKWISESRAQKVIRNALDKGSILYAATSSDRQVEKLLDILIKSKRLTTAYLLRAICMGNITLFCRALSRLSSVPCDRVEAMIAQKHLSAFRAAFVKSGMPPEAFEVFMMSLDIWRKLLKKLHWMPRERMPSLVVRQLIDKHHGAKNQVVDDLFMLLQSISSDIAKNEARMLVMELSNKHMERKEKDKRQTKTDQLLIDDQCMRNMETSIVQGLKEDSPDLFSEDNLDIPGVAANDSLISEQKMAIIKPYRMAGALSIPVAA